MSGGSRFASDCLWLLGSSPNENSSTWLDDSCDLVQSAGMKLRQDVQPRVGFESRLLLGLGERPEFLGQDERLSLPLPMRGLGEQLVSVAPQTSRSIFSTLFGQKRRLPVMSRRY